MTRSHYWPKRLCPFAFIALNLWLNTHRWVFCFVFIFHMMIVTYLLTAPYHSWWHTLHLLNTWLKMADETSRWYHSTLWINSLWPSDSIKWQRIKSILPHAMACCLAAPSHYLNQCCLITNKVQYHSSEGNFMRDTTAINDKVSLKISLKSPRGQWVNLRADSFQTFP